ncbi:DEAD/DEAH box helicase, partial [Streptomyces altiplanensis]
MNRAARSNDRDRFSRTRAGGNFAGRTSDRGERFRPAGPGRSSGSSGSSRRPAQRRSSAPQGEFALPVSTTPALPAVETFGELDMPAPLLAALAA